VLKMWSLDMNYGGQLTMVFNKAINAALTIVTSLTIGSIPRIATSPQYTLTSGSKVSSASYGDVVVVSLSYTDYIGISKLAPNLATSVRNAYLSILQSGVSELSPTRNGIAPIFYAYAVKASSVQLDRVPPTITSYDVDMVNGFATFFFNKVRVPVLSPHGNVPPLTLQITASLFFRS